MLQLDDQVTVERVRDAQQGVDARRPAAGFETRDGGLGGPAPFGELLLGQVLADALVGHLVGDSREEPAALVDVGNPLAQPLECTPPASSPCRHPPIVIAALLSAHRQPL